MPVLFKEDGGEENFGLMENIGLEFAQDKVGGYVTIVRFGPDNKGMMLVDEEGEMKLLPYNAEASFLAGRIILGHALVIQTNKGERF